MTEWDVENNATISLTQETDVTKDKAPSAVLPTTHNSSGASELDSMWHRVVGRRSFLAGAGVAGAAAAVAPTALFTGSALAEKSSGKLNKGDAAILRFLAAAEIIESDLWQQYSELGGANGGNTSYVLALQNLDGDMPQYISDNTDDEISHAQFLNKYLEQNGAKPVSLEKFRRLKGSKATGADQKARRLTNLQSLNVDTSWYRRYRSRLNPDFGDFIPQALTIHKQPAIPLNDVETPPSTQQPVPPVTEAARRMQAIANTAGFHFAFIEQGGSSLYATMALKASSLEALRIVVSIGGVEIDHFGLWHDKAGNAVNDPLAGVTDPKTGLNFPNLNKGKFTGEAFQTNLILPEPAKFLRSGLPDVSVIRPTSVANSGAVAAIKSLRDDRLFEGQKSDFVQYLFELAHEADAAERRTY
jgi:hypothetical protein